MNCNFSEEWLFKYYFLDSIIHYSTLRPHIFYQNVANCVHKFKGIFLILLISLDLGQRNTIVGGSLKSNAVYVHFQCNNMSYDHDKHTHTLSIYVYIHAHTHTHVVCVCMCVCVCVYIYLEREREFWPRTFLSLHDK